MTTFSKIPYNEDVFTFCSDDIQIKLHGERIVKSKPRAIHLIPTTNNTNRSRIVYNHICQILEIDSHYCILVIKNTPDVELYVTMFLSQFSTEQLSRIHIEIFDTPYTSHSAGETREAAKLFFKRLCTYMISQYSTFVLRISDDRRESRSLMHKNDADAYTSLHTLLFYNGEQHTVFGCVPQRIWTKHINTSLTTQHLSDFPTRQFQCMQTLFMTPHTFLHLMRVCYDKPQNLSAYCAPILEDYCFLDSMLKNNINVQQTLLFGRYTYTCESIARKKNVSSGYAEEQKGALRCIIDNLSISHEIIDRRNIFVIRMHNGVTQKITRQQGKKSKTGFEVHWEVLKKWFDGKLQTSAHHLSPVNVIDLTHDVINSNLCVDIKSGYITNTTALANSNIYTNSISPQHRPAPKQRVFHTRAILRQCTHEKQKIMRDQKVCKMRERNANCVE